MKNKVNRLEIRLSDHDLAIIKQKAGLSQMSVSEYLRIAGTQRKVDGYNRNNVSVPEAQIDGQMTIEDITEDDY